MNNQRAVSASKNNNTQRTAQSLGVTLDHRVDFYALGAYWMRHTLCVVIFGCTHCVQTVHVIIFCPITDLSSWQSLQPESVCSVPICLHIWGVQSAPWDFWPGNFCWCRENNEKKWLCPLWKTFLLHPWWTQIMEKTLETCSVSFEKMMKFTLWSSWLKTRTRLHRFQNSRAVRVKDV